MREIPTILGGTDDEADLLQDLRRRRAGIDEKIRRYREVARSLERFTDDPREARQIMTSSGFDVEEKVLDPILIAAVRMYGKYSNCGIGFADLGRSFGRHIRGKAMMLHHSTEYRENDADFEVCFPMRPGKHKEVDGISVRELPGGRCISLMHKGPYDELGRSYEKITRYLHGKGYHVELTSREVYIKGPGMIFKGNPRNYLTEIQMLIRE